MNEKQFKASYIAQFLASYMAQLYEAAHQRDWAAINRVLKQMYDTMFEEGL